MIKKFKNILDIELFKKVWTEIASNPWWLDHQTKYGSTLFFSQHISSDNVYKEVFVDLSIKLKELIQPYFDESILPFKVKVNGQVFGQNGSFHYDFTEEDIFTFVFFPSLDWNLSWGGEIIIFDPFSKEYIYYPPLPNTGILFPSRYDHVGMGPNREGNQMRVSIAVNFILKSREYILEKYKERKIVDL